MYARRMREPRNAADLSLRTRDYKSPIGSPANPTGPSQHQTSVAHTARDLRFDDLFVVQGLLCSRWTWS